MKTEKSQSNAITLPPKSIKGTLLALLGCLIVVLLIGWLINYYILVPRQERRRFLTAEQKLDTAAAKITRLPVDKKKSCSRAQEKYGPGSTSCSVEVSIAVEDTDLESAQVFSVFDSIDGFQKNSRSKQQEFHQYSYSKLSCSAEKEEARYTIRCGGIVTRPVYNF